MSKNILYLGIVLVVLFLVGGVISLVSQQRQEQRTAPLPLLLLPPAQTPQEQEGLGGQLYENPAAKVPETNPFGVETNPFQGYKNPFE